MNSHRVRRDDSFVREAALLAVIAGLVPAAGCRSGSWVTKPSWMTFGQKTEDAEQLSSAPAFAGDVQKPSATAKPYPTTSTPDAYSLPDPTAQASTAPGAAPAAVTYGSTPPPATAPSLAATAPSGPAATPVTSSIAPQVGPYATSAAATPADAPPLVPTSPMAPSSGWGTTPQAAVPAAVAATEPPPATVSTAPPPWATSPPAVTSPAAPPERFADARAASPSWNPTPLDTPPAATGRYGTSGTSRFASAAQPAAASMLPAAPSGMQPAMPAELQPASVPPGVPAAPAAAPAGATPLRRPDPAYRPGGTSSYRPARASLAGEPPTGVQPASFELPSQAN